MMTERMTERDQRLQQLGITQYQLRRPAVLQGEVAVSLPEHTRLVVVANQIPSFSESLMQDIVQALGLTLDHVYCLMPEHAVMLPKERSCAVWLVGDVGEQDADAFPAELYLTSPDFIELSQSAAAKRALWQQICQHEYYFFPQA